MSKKQGLFWMLMAVLAHFFLNTPFNEGLTSNSGEITVLMLCFSFCVALATFFKVDQIETTQHYQ
ncbi:hypothetical protein ACS6ZY_10150 [Streptococcus suis]